MNSHKQKYITLKHLVINNKKQIGLQFFPDKVIQALVKGLSNIKWSNEFNMAFVPNNKTQLTELFNTFRGVAYLNTNHFFKNKPIHTGNELPNITHYRNRPLKPGYIYVPKAYLDKLEARRYALNTCKTYIHLFELFINHFKDYELIAISEEDIKSYLLNLMKAGKSDTTVNQALNAIKFYYESVLGMPNRFYTIDRPKKKEKLPEVLSKKSIQLILQQTTNLKHKALLTLLYSSGMRIGELLALKIADIDSERMLIHVKNGKGGKDRYTLLSTKALILLRKYYSEYKPSTFLFESVIKGKRYSNKSVNKIIQKSCLKANIKKRVTAHTFRHSFATHLLEDGVDLRYIQTLLGHNSSKTTEIYTKVAMNVVRKIKNPLD